MSMRLLSEAEKEHERVVRIAYERLSYPYHEIIVTVDDYTDSDGHPLCRILIRGNF